MKDYITLSELVNYAAAWRDKQAAPANEPSLDDPEWQGYYKNMERVTAAEVIARDFFFNGDMRMAVDLVNIVSDAQHYDPEKRAGREDTLPFE